LLSVLLIILWLLCTFAKTYVSAALLDAKTLPLLYAGAMLVDAVAAMFFGILYDKEGVKL